MIWKQYTPRLLGGLEETEVVLVIDINCAHKANWMRHLSHNHKVLEGKKPVWISFQKLS